MFEILLINLGIGVGAGALTAIGTYTGKLKKDKTMEFDLKKFLRTVAVGALTGLISGVSGGGVDSPELAIATATGNFGVVNILDHSTKFLWRLFSKKI